ncbi:MAG: inositol phosphorylceramide synthase [Acidimicrobiaceae bacterium]|nr:inositol phosphorylceramide synthase [Acidimicrobiaceae bacterium]
MRPGPADELPGEHRSGVGATPRELAVQVVVVVSAALLYFGVRGFTEGSEEIAVRNAERLLRIENGLGLANEDSLQALILDHRWLVTFFNWIYIWGHWPVIIAVLAWLFVRHRVQYRLLFRSMLISGAIGLIVFALYPVSPPRLMPDGEFVDTVTELSRSYRVLQPPALVNKYAALPSLHVGWNLLVGITVFRASRAVWLRVFAIVSPLLMMAAVVLTGNHYVVDGFVGSAVAALGLLGAMRLARRDREHSDTLPVSGPTLEAPL